MECEAGERVSMRVEAGGERIGRRGREQRRCEEIVGVIVARVSVLGQELLNHGGALLRSGTLELLQLLLDGIWSRPQRA